MRRSTVQSLPLLLVFPNAAILFFFYFVKFYTVTLKAIKLEKMKS
jgi:hypothetical protein